MPTKSVPIELKGRNYFLRYDFNALCALESEIGASLANLGAILSDAPKLSDLRTIIWAGLQHEDKSLSIEAVGALLDIADIAKVADKVSEAFESAFPDAEATVKNEKGSKPIKKKNGTSKDS